jgi:hypothetical protein
VPLAAQICNKDALLDAELQREEAVQRRKQEEAEAAEDEFKPPDPQVNVGTVSELYRLRSGTMSTCANRLCCFVC